jgi:hypothetical protein
MHFVILMLVIGKECFWNPELLIYYWIRTPACRLPAERYFNSAMPPFKQ